MITAKRLHKAATREVTRAWLKGTGRFRTPESYCPACRKSIVGFFRYGSTAAWGCPQCGSSPRERLMHCLLDKGLLEIPPRAAVLHMAPNEASMVSRLRSAAARYVPADLEPGRYSLPDIRKVDLMELDETNAYDIIYASHVMEHVPDDGRVLDNLYRALKPGGQAWLIVPLWDRPTEDGNPGMSARERERRFGQWDHVRQYGMDFSDRIKKAGFTLKTFAAREFDRETRRRSALDDAVFVGSKPGNGSRR